MPELPEVETVRRGLEATVVGQRIVDVVVTGARSVRRQPSAELRSRLFGRRIDAAMRRGKFLALPLDDGQVLVVHLRMSGRLLYVAEPERSPALPHTHIVASFSRGGELRFVDPRTFGEWYVTDGVDGAGLPAELARMGPDPLLDGLGPRALAARLAASRRPIKAALTDQRVLAGIGNLYADEICFAARLRPDRSAASLEMGDHRRLARSIARVLREATEARGSSLRDESYRDLMGDLGSYQDHHKVYGRAGAPCERCGAPVVKLGFGARVAYCCEGCQL